MIKRNKWQMYENQHPEPKDIDEDNDTVNEICDLYDKGVDLKMIKKVFKEIEKVRAQDLSDDISALESRQYI